MVFKVYRRTLLSLVMNLCLQSIFKHKQKYKSEVFDNIQFHFRISKTLRIHIFYYSFIIYISIMATSASKKWKIQEEIRLFKIEWERKYFFVEDSSKFICLIGRETIASAKKGNFERYYNTKHQSNFVGILGESRKTKLDNLKRNLKS